MTRYSRLPAAALQSPGVRLHAPGKQISEAAARLAAALARRSAGEQRSEAGRSLAGRHAALGLHLARPPRLLARGVGGGEGDLVHVHPALGRGHLACSQSVNIEFRRKLGCAVLY